VPDETVKEEAEWKPRIRPVEAFPVESRGKRLILLRDASGIAPGQAVLSPAAFFVAARFDGAHGVRDIQEEFLRESGEILFTEKIREIADQLDKAYLLDSNRFAQHLRNLKKDFSALAVRPASSAGTAYEADPEKLGPWLDALFEPPDGPGRPVPGSRAEPLRALAAPHVDLMRGGAVYAHAWKAAAEGPAPDCVVILGTAHFGQAEPLFIATDKAFATPLGESPADAPVIEGLRRRLGDGIFEEEFTHAREHSVEFQVLMAQKAFGAGIPIVPVLACSFHEFVGSGKEPGEDPRVRGFVEALRESLAEAGRKALLVASADLSHVGPRFGDERRSDAAVMNGVRQSDAGALRNVCAMDAAGFFARIRQTNDRTRICGTACLYTLLCLLEGSGLRGVLRKHASTVDETGSAVTFAAITFE